MPTFPDVTRALVRRWDRKAAVYDLVTGPMDRMLGIAKNRGRLFDALTGRVLEIGAGTGKNVPHYQAGPAIVASDLSPGMLKRLRARTDARTRASVVAADAEDLPFRDASFDAVVASCVFCTVPDPVRGLRELRRVLKDGGRLRLLEHVRPSGVLGRLFDAVDPLAARLIGPHINRPTLDNVRRAGFIVVEETNIFSDWVKVVVAR